MSEEIKNDLDDQIRNIKRALDDSSNAEDLSSEVHDLWRAVDRCAEAIELLRKQLDK